MKKITLDTVFKTIIMISLVYSLYLLTLMANNSSNGRYQGVTSSGVAGVIDTKTGTAHFFDNDGKLKELKFIDSKGE